MLNHPMLKVSGFYQDPGVILTHDDSITGWSRFTPNDITHFKIAERIDSGLSFTFPSRAWTLDCTISSLEGEVIKIFGIRSGTNLKSGTIGFKNPASGYKIYMSLHIGDGKILKRELVLSDLVNLEFCFRR